MISVIVPTIEGREEYLQACKAAYAAHTTGNELRYELIVVPGYPTCGSAWVDGAGRASGEYIHFSADDLRPHEGWSDAAISTVRRGFLPAPRILNDDGTIQSCGGSDGWGVERPTGEETDFSRIPFLARDQWEQVRGLVEPFLRDAHYYTDNAISFAAAKVGIRTGVHRSFCFSHSLAPEGRGAGMSWADRMKSDFQKFEAWSRAL